MREKTRAIKIMKFEFSYHNAGHLFPVFHLTTEEVSVLKNSSSNLKFGMKVGHLSIPFQLNNTSITIPPNFQATAACSPDVFAMLLAHLVLYKIIDEAKKTELLNSYAQQYKNLPHIGKNPIDYSNQFMGPTYRKEIDHLNSLIGTHPSHEVRVWAACWCNYFQQRQFEAALQKISNRIVDQKRSQPAVSPLNQTGNVTSKSVYPGTHSLAQFCLFNYYQGNIKPTILQELIRAIDIAYEHSDLKSLLIQLAFFSTFGFFKDANKKLSYLTINEVADETKMLAGVEGYFDGDSNIFLASFFLEGKYQLFFHEITHALIEFQEQNDRAEPFAREDIQAKEAWNNKTAEFFKSLHTENIAPEIFNLHSYPKSQHTAEMAARLAELAFLLAKGKSPREERSTKTVLELFSTVTKNTCNYNETYIEYYGLHLITGFKNNNFFTNTETVTLTQEDCHLINEAIKQQQPILDIKINQLLKIKLSITDIITKLKKQGITDRALLYAAARIGNSALVEKLLEQVTFAPEDLTGALTEAAKFKHTSIVKLLIEKGVNPFSDSVTITALHFAVMYGDAELAQLLLDHPEHRITQDRNGNTALHYAAGNKNVSIVNLLLKKSTRYGKLANHNGLFPLHSAAMQADNLAVLAALLQNEDGVWTDKKERTLLHYLTQIDDAASLKVLTGPLKAQVNEPDQFGETPLHWAVTHSSVNACKILLAHAFINPNIVNKADITPLYLAIMSGQFELAELFLACPHLLVDTVNLNGRTYLHAAALKGNIELAQLLIDKQSMLEIKDNDGNTSLELAIREGHYDFAKFLIVEIKAANSEFENFELEISLISLLKKLENSSTRKAIQFEPLLDFIDRLSYLPKVSLVPEQINRILTFATDEKLQNQVKKIKSHFNITPPLKTLPQPAFWLKATPSQKTVNAQPDQPVSNETTFTQTNQQF